MPSDSIEMIRYSVNTAANPSAVERPTSRTYFARPEITTAPSMPVKTRTRAMHGRGQPARQSQDQPALPEVVHKAKISTLNLPRSTILSTKSPSSGYQLRQRDDRVNARSLLNATKHKGR